jgi:hypothetical protein
MNRPAPSFSAGFAQRAARVRPLRSLEDDDDLFAFQPSPDPFLMRNWLIVRRRKDGLTYKQIGIEYDVSADRVRQIICRHRRLVITWSLRQP